MSGGELVPAAGVRTCTTPPWLAQYAFHAAGVAPWAVAAAAHAASPPATIAAVTFAVRLTAHPLSLGRGDSLTTRRVSGS
jgi:hypothetical protein